MSLAPRPQNATAPRRSRRLGYYGLACFLGLAVVGGATPPEPPPAAAMPPAPQPTGNAAAPAPAAASPMDEPIKLITAAREAYSRVQDYSCVLVKRERMGAQPPPENVMLMNVRTRPFSVYLRWQQPRDLAGQEVCYVTGRYNGQMRVRSAGALGVVGFVSLDLNDPRARKTSRHSIKEAGIGNVIERFRAGWEGERRLNLTQVRIGEYEYNKRRCTRVETIHPARKEFLHYRSVVYFDQQNHLPIRVECYDWPRAQGDPGQLTEVFSFVNLRLNVGLSDAVFNH
jgi:hypothetical protein